MKKFLITILLFALTFGLFAQTKSQTVDPNDSLALIALYKCTDGSHWNHTWDTTQPVSTWYGVSLDQNGKVTALYLNDNNLNGTIPSEIGNLTNLQYLYLNNNQLRGFIPSEIGNLSNLQWLYLDYNQLSGYIPSEIGNLTNLQWLYLNNNQLSGPIPSEIGDLANLQKLYLNNNQLSGAIPREIGNLTNLQVLWLFSNRLSGTIPSELWDLTSLQNLYLNNNQLSGAIPSEIGNLVNLQELVLSYNQFCCSIPPELGNMTNLQYIYLYNNQFVELPDLSSSSLDPKSFDVANNKLTFEDIESNVSKLTRYSPQAKVGTVQHFSPNSGDTLFLSVSVGGSANTYQWYKDDVLIRGATNAIYKITNYNPSTDAGIYYCKINNTIATTLTLESQKIYVGVPVNQYQVIVTATPSEGGTVDGGGTYSDGDTISLTATPNSGYLFSYWTLNGDIVSYEREYTILVSKDAEYVANFRKGYVITVTLNHTNAGEITGTGTFDYGAIDTLIARSNNGYKFVNWTNKNGDTISKDSMFIFVVTQDSNFTANFLYLDSLALIALYNSTDGANWINKWDLTQPVSTWYGVTLDQNGRVTSLDLDNNNLSGIIPIEICSLNNLQRLNLSYNQLSGCIPSEIGDLKKLQILHLQNNQLSGTIPQEIGNLTNLKTLDLSSNQLRDTIPVQIGNLANLQELYLFNNNLNGSIPSEIFNLANLSWLDLHRNHFSGSISTQIGNMSNLKYLDLSYNQFCGTIPSEIGNLSNLVFLGVSYNQLSGNVPGVIGNLINLWELYLNDNQFVGLPDLSSSSLNPMSFDVSNNKLTFEDIEPNVSKLKKYSPQEKIGTVEHYSPNIGDNLDLTVSVGGSANTYQWYKDGSPIPGATNATYSISDYNPTTDKGIYYCEVKNTIATELTLFSHKIYVGEPVTQYHISAEIAPIDGGIITGTGFFEDGTVDTLIATPNVGYLFTYWTHNGNIISTNPQYIFTVTRDSSFVANFTPITFIITAEVNPENTGIVTGTGTFIYGSIDTLLAIPNTGYRFVSWTQNGNIVSTDPQYIFKVTENADFVANFEIKKLNINVSVEPLGAGIVTGSGTFEYGTLDTLIATPMPGYQFVGWKQNGTFVSFDPQYIFTVTEDSSFVAVFMLKAFSITAIINPENSGTVIGTGIFDYGTIDTLIATPNAGYLFVNWTTQNGDTLTSNHIFIFTVTQDCSLVANFTQGIIISASVNPPEGGIVLGTGTYKYGDTVTLTALPNSGYQFFNWTKNGVEVSKNPELTITVTEDAQYVANFLKVFTITALAKPPEGGIVTGAGTFVYGAVDTLKATPNPGYIFVNWTTQNGDLVYLYPVFIFPVYNDTVYIANFSLSSGIPENTIPNIKIFPNPVRQVVNILADDIYRIGLYDISGKLIRIIYTKSEITEINLSHLKPGVYIIKLTGQRESYIYRIIKQ